MQLALKKSATPAARAHLKLPACTQAWDARPANIVCGARPTSRDVAAHHGHVALVDEVADGHVPAGRAAFAGVAALLPLQVVDVDGRVVSLHHSHRKVGR